MGWAGVDKWPGCRRDNRILETYAAYVCNYEAGGLFTLVHSHRHNLNWSQQKYRLRMRKLCAVILSAAMKVNLYLMNLN